jgi:hypothetical protein
MKTTRGPKRRGGPHDICHPVHTDANAWGKTDGSGTYMVVMLPCKVVLDLDCSQHLSLKAIQTVPRSQQERESPSKPQKIDW